MVLREQDKHFLWSLFVAVSVILMWKGIWEGMYEIPTQLGYPQFSDPFVFLFLGFVMLTFSGIIFKEFDPLGSLDKSANRMMQYIHNHPHKHEFTIKYYDKSQKKEFLINAERLKHIEKGTLVIEHPNGRQELFIPLSRVTEVQRQGKPYWKM